MSAESSAAWNSYWLIERPVEGRAHLGEFVRDDEDGQEREVAWVECEVGEEVRVGLWKLGQSLPVVRLLSEVSRVR